MYKKSGACGSNMELKEQLNKLNHLELNWSIRLRRSSFISNSLSLCAKAEDSAARRKYKRLQIWSKNNTFLGELSGLNRISGSRERVDVLG